MKKNLAPNLLFGITLATSLMITDPADAQPSEFNYDESKVPQFTLPNPLLTNQEIPVKDASTWRTVRRPEILRLFQTQMYGTSPGRPESLKFKVLSQDDNALDGKATRKQVAVWFTGQPEGPGMEILIYLPNQATKPVSTFLGFNFNGNHSIHPDPGIHLSQSWMRNDAGQGRTNNQATEAARGKSANRWAVDKILERGYGLATIYYGDVEPDHAEGWKGTLRSVIKAPPSAAPTHQSQSLSGAPPEASLEDWGAIAAWAWALSRAMDYFETDSDINHKKVAVLGHSRLGKTSLWAGAEDERFAIVISNNSGCGGAALSKRRFGETVKRINTSFPHWFCGAFKQYNDKESSLPFDQHMLIALMAPRPVYVASAVEDRWADPRGEFLSAKHAEPVYALFQKPGLNSEKMPAIDQPVSATLGYHIRSGGHDVKDYDWEQYLKFADHHFGHNAQESEQE